MKGRYLKDLQEVFWSQKKRNAEFQFEMLNWKKRSRWSTDNGRFVKRNERCEINNMETHKDP